MTLCLLSSETTVGSTLKIIIWTDFSAFLKLSGRIDDELESDDKEVQGNVDTVSSPAALPPSGSRISPMNRYPKYSR